MILNDFLIINERGLYCPYGDFYLDPQLASGHAIISHAHADQAVHGNNFVYCTPPTAAIMQHRYKRNSGNRIQTYAWSIPFKLNGINISFIPAGHILGSAQVLMEYKGIKYLYTGDYKIQDDLSCERIEFVKADVLITETTFADPAIEHPPATDEIKKLNLSNHNVLLGAYSLGKAQRLIGLISEHCPKRRILVHHSIFGLNKLYEQFGFPLGQYELYTRKLMKDPGQNMVYIVPPLTFNSYRQAKDVLRAFASGWINLQLNNDLKILISDHVDWKNILNMIDKVDPSEVWTLHGNGKHLKAYFKNHLFIKILNDAC